MESRIMLIVLLHNWKLQVLHLLQKEIQNLINNLLICKMAKNFHMNYINRIENLSIEEFVINYELVNIEFSLLYVKKLINYF